MTDDELPHDSAYVYSQLKNKHTEAVFPTLHPKEKAGIGRTLAIAALMLLVVMGAWGVGYELQYNLLTPPTVLHGICPAPAVIQSSGCFLSTVTTNTQGQVSTVLVPAGHMEELNQTGR